MRKGYYRIKLSNLPEGDTEVKFYKNGVLSLTAIARMKSYCENEILVKYLDRMGRYRFFPFNKYYETKEECKSIGNINKLVTSIFDSQTDSRGAGYNITRTLSLVAESVTNEELLILSDIYSSPCVYMNLRRGKEDLKSDWVQISVKGDGISKRRKNNFGKVVIDVELPRYFSQTMF